jgi:glycerol-3-phosphate acyltransferase PlsX
LKTVTVALDAMGGDLGPRITVPAAVQALSHFPDLKVILVGDRSTISSQLSTLGVQPSERLSVQHTDKVISDSEKPSLALRHHHGSSMGSTIDLVATSKADACVSSGNTGALMALSRFKLKLLPGVERPALISALPTASGERTWMLDLGANVSSDAEALFQFAVMGNCLVEQYIHRRPRVALLNIGAEEIKGNDLVKRCAEMLSETQSINFTGYIEGNQLLTDKADVIVCDGFVGNVCLKACEGTAQLFIEKLRASIMSKFWKGWIAQKLFSSAFNALKTLNPDQYNGASLLGLRGIVIKSHGSANVEAVTNAIGEAIQQVKLQVPSRISDRLEAILLERHY